jgi:hypothetical protein
MFVYKQLPTKVIALEEDNWKQEAYIEGFLIENIQIFAKEDEDSEARFLERQITLEGKKRIDILILMLSGKKGTGVELKIVEIKKEKASIKDLNQLVEYMDRWRREGSTIVKREELTEIIKKSLEVYGKKEVGIEDLSGSVKGILVAPDFDEGVKDSIKESKDIEGIKITRRICNELKEIYIFVDYFPERKIYTPITREEFWKGRATRRMHQVEELLKKVEENIPGIAYLYWSAMISIYPSEEARASKTRIARYVRGDKSILIKTENGEDKRIDLEKESEIIEEIKKAQRRIKMERDQ